MTRDWRVVAGVAVAGLFAAVLLFALTTSPDPGPPAPKVRPARPAAPVPVPGAPSVRRSVPPPTGVEAPEPPDERPEPAKVTPDLRREMNFAMDAVLRAARQDCLQPWLDVDPSGPPVEVVFDAVLFDGKLVDFGLRSLGPAVPDEVVACVADAVWYGDWPDWEIRGELRLQRAVELEPSR